MLPPKKIKEIKILLTLGKLSQRKIAEMAGVSRSVIHRIVAGKSRQTTQQPREEWSGSKTNEPFHRCPTCGGKVQLPCLACFVRKQSKTMVFSEPISCNFELELNDIQKFRYEQIKRRRESRHNPPREN